MTPESVELHVLRLEFTKKLPEVIIVWTPHIVCQFMYQCVDEIVIWPKAFCIVSSQPKDNHPASILVVAEKVHIWILALLFHPLLCVSWAHLCKNAHLKVPGLHDLDDARVGCKLLEQLLCLIWRRRVVLELRLYRMKAILWILFRAPR